MKSSELKQLIRETITTELKEIVREAVDYAVAREFRLLREELTRPIKTEITQVKKSLKRNPTKKASSKKSFLKMMGEEEKMVSDNNEEILTETREPIFKTGPFADILNETKPFTKSDEMGIVDLQQQVPLGRNALQPRMVDGDTIVATTNDMVAVPLQDPDGRPLNTQVLQTEKGQTVLKNITKDYSSFMKKMDQKAKKRRGQ